MKPFNSLHATPLLVTGCYRSGTTVLDKILNSHPEIAVASQPFPVLYALVKQRFLTDKGLQRRYPLGHLFLETGYTESEFHAFLANYKLSDEDIIDFFDQMDEYRDGILTPEMLQARGLVEKGTFWEVYTQLILYLESRFPRDQIKYRGTKEVLVEEYIPSFSSHGAAIIIVVRDPRAMIASLNFRERASHTGAQRPVLFSLRAWRKSVALALTLAGTQNAKLIRYEDITLKTSETLEEISTALAISPFPQEVLVGDIMDQHGQPWLGNSSFETKKGISNHSVYTWKKKLPRKVVEYVETICLPEMRLLGYEPDFIDQFKAETVREYRDPFSEVHEKFSTDYSHDPRRVNEEITRFHKLEEDLVLTEQRKWFLNEIAYHRLRECIFGQS